MLRQVLYGRLKPGALAEYKRLHDAVPREYPDLARAIRAAGIHREVVFTAGPILIVYAEVDDAEAYDRLFATDVHKRWAELMAPLMETGADGLADIRFMDQVWKIEFPELDDRRA